MTHCIKCLCHTREHPTPSYPFDQIPISDQFPDNWLVIAFRINLTTSHLKTGPLLSVSYQLLLGNWEYRMSFFITVEHVDNFWLGTFFFFGNLVIDDHLLPLTSLMVKHPIKFITPNIMGFDLQHFLASLCFKLFLDVLNLCRCYLINFTIGCCYHPSYLIIVPFFDFTHPQLSFLLLSPYLLFLVYRLIT